jgi:hypothetical protein
MIEELFRGKQVIINDEEISRPLHTRGHFCPILLHDPMAISNSKWMGALKEDVRLPWIHKSDPVDCHSSNALPSVNHVALPLR